jgi:Na+/H+ antiporter
MDTAYTWIAMLLAVALVGLLARIVSIPYPILLVAAGLGIGLAPGLHPPPLDPDLILLFFLPVLLYNEAFHTSWRDFSRWLRPIVMLAVGLVGVTILAVGVVAKLLLPELPWAAAFVLGAIVSPTDTVAANAVLQRLRVPRRLSAVLGGESLVNDATGLVALQLGIGVVLSGAFHWWDVGRDFAWTVAGGVAVGLLVAMAAHEANRRIRDTTVLFTISLIAPFVAFSGAHVLHASGVLSVVVAGFFVSWRFHTVAADTRYELYTVWRLLAYIVDALCFLLIGIEIPRLMRIVSEDALPHLLAAGGLVTLTVILVRFVWMYPAAYIPFRLFPGLLQREGGAPPKRNVFLAAWCGMRGAVSLAAALSVPMLVNGQPFVGRDALIICTFCVILGTLIVQGLTLQPLVRWLGIRDDENAAEQERLARIAIIGAALLRLTELRAVPGVDPEAVDHVEAVYMERLRILIGAPALGFAKGDPAGPAGGLFGVELEAIRAERQRLLGLRDSSDINDLTHDQLQEELDVAEMRAKTHRSIPSAI